MRIVIVGASSGIGLAVAEEFACRGIRLGLAARRLDTLNALKAKYPDTIEVEQIDVTKEDAPSRLHRLVTKLGGMDVYFHVAGIGFENLTLDPQREVDIISTNAGGFARMLSAAYRYFRDNRRRGRIAAVTSVAGTRGIGRLSAYSASKACAQHYMEALEQLANAEGAEVSFTDIRPGWIRTPLLEKGRKYPMEMDLEYAVPLIIRAIVRRPRVAYIDLRWGALVQAWKRLPAAVWTKMDVHVSDPDSPLPAPAHDPFPKPSEEAKQAARDIRDTLRP